MLFQESDQRQGGVMTRIYFYHPEVDVFSRTARPTVFYSPHTTAVCQRLQFYQLVGTCKVVERPGIISSCYKELFYHQLYFFLFFEVPVYIFSSCLKINRF